MTVDVELEENGTAALMDVPGGDWADSPGSVITKDRRRLLLREVPIVAPRWAVHSREM